MQMIKDLGKRPHKDGFNRSWGLYKCPFCDKEIEKQQYYGNLRQSCGCATHLTWTKRRSNYILAYRIIDSLAYFKTKNGVEFIIDEADVLLIKDICWSITSTGYVWNTTHGVLHRFLTGFSMTDHKDGNKLNNSRCNLRPCDNRQNQWNKKKNRGSSSSRFKGVRYRKDTRKWSASIECDGKRYNLGCYKDEDIAAKAYDFAAIKLFGDFAKPNF